MRVNQQSSKDLGGQFLLDTYINFVLSNDQQESYHPMNSSDSGLSCWLCMIACAYSKMDTRNLGKGKRPPRCLLSN
jgi:hypothetical protein